jgi:hypothetical protein
MPKPSASYIKVGISLLCLVVCGSQANAQSSNPEEPTQPAVQAGPEPVASTGPSPKAADGCPGSTEKLEKIFLEQNIQIGTVGPSQSPLYLGRTHMGLPWQRDFVAVVLDMMNGDLYWYDDLEKPANRLVKIPKGRAFFPAAYTKEKMLLVVCNAHFNTSAGVTPTNITVPEATAEVAAAAAAPTAPAAPAAVTPNTIGTTPVTQSATPTSPPQGGGRGAFFRFNLPNREPPAILGPQAPSAADSQKVVDAFLAYEKTYQATSKQIQTLMGQSEQIMKDVKSKMAAIQAKSSSALAENQKAAGDYAAALEAKNPSLIYEDAVTSAVEFTSNEFPKISDQITTLTTNYNTADFNNAVKTLQMQYQAIFDAVFAFANNTPDVAQLTQLLRANPQPYPDKVGEWQSLRMTRISKNEDAIKEAVDSELRKQDPKSKTFASLEAPKVLADDATHLATYLKSMLPQLKAAVKDMVRTLNDDYVKSRVYIVIPVPSVSSNSLQLFSVTVTDNYKPLTWTDTSPAPGTTGQGVGGACPKGCVLACPPATCPVTPPAPAANPTPGTTPSPGVGLQLTAIKPGGAATISASPVQVSQQVDGAGNVAITASFIVPFHRIVHFAADGGFLTALIPSNSFTSETLPDTVVTTTTTTTTTSAATTITQTIVPTTSTSTFAFQSEKQRYQTAGILGVSWYPMGRDSFVVSRKAALFNRPATYTYSRHTLAQQLSPGLLLATAVNTAGTFVIAPVWDISPGVSLFGGLTLADKTSLPHSITLCNSLGSSTSVVNYGPTTTTSGGTTVTTAVLVETTTGCSNPNATMLSGTTVPTTSGIVPGFGFGIVFNSSLFSYFAGKN